MKTKKVFFFIVIFSWTLGCATYQNKVKDAQQSLRQGRPGEAVKFLEPLANKESDDQLVYLLEYATALQASGKFKESNQAFHKADKMSEVQDYHSISRITGSLLLSEGMVQYKGEDYEKVLINAFSAINYLMLGELDEALVEARRLNEKLNKYKNDAKRPYEQNAFARYLSAMIWESDKKWDDAYIDYKEAYRLNPNFLGLHKDLVRVSKKSGRMTDYQKWRSKFPDVKWNKEWDNNNFGEIVVIYQQGWGPVKRANPDSPRFPKLFYRSSKTKQARVEVAGNQVITEEVYSISDVAVKTFNDQMGALIAKRIAGIVAKEAVAHRLRKENELLGIVAWVGMHASDRADTRQWSMLPQGFQVARVRLPAGKYKINVSGQDKFGVKTGEGLFNQEVEVRPGKLTFINWRSYL